MTVTDHISETVMQSFYSGMLPAIDTIMCAEHIEICPECSQLFRQISKISQSYHRGGAHFSPEVYLLGRHLDYEQISAYLDDQINKAEAEFVKLHLELCSICSEEVSSLKEFRKAVDTELQARHSPLGFIRKLISSLRKPKPPNLIYVFGTLAAVILLGFVILMIYRWRSQSKNPYLIAPTTVTPSPQLPDSDLVKDKGKKVQPLLPPDQGSKTNPGSRSDRAVSAKTSVIFDKGKRYVVAFHGNQMRVSNLAPELREDALRLLSGEDLRDPVVPEALSTPPGELRGSDEKQKAVLLSPVGTLIEEDRPVLKWKPVEGSNNYVVDIVDEQFRPVTQSPRLQSTEWRVNQHLKRDAVYMWQVTQYKDNERIGDPINPVGKYKVISEKKLNELQKARKKYTSHLELGIYYLREGFLDEAEKEFQALRSRNPNSKLVNMQKTQR